jgi:Asp/Glu/hydantoin racemase
LGRCKRQYVCFVSYLCCILTPAQIRGLYEEALQDAQAVLDVGTAEEQTKAAMEVAAYQRELLHVIQVRSVSGWLYKFLTYQ